MDLLHPLVLPFWLLRLRSQDLSNWDEGRSHWWDWARDCSQWRWRQGSWGTTSAEKRGLWSQKVADCITSLIKECLQSYGLTLDVFGWYYSHNFFSTWKKSSKKKSSSSFSSSSKRQHSSSSKRKHSSSSNWSKKKSSTFRSSSSSKRGKKQRSQENVLMSTDGMGVAGAVRWLGWGKVVGGGGRRLTNHLNLWQVNIEVRAVKTSFRSHKDLTHFLTPWNRRSKGLLEYYRMLKSHKRLDNVWHATLTCLFWKTQLLTSPTAWSSSSSTIYSENVAFIVFCKKILVAVGLVHLKKTRSCWLNCA